MNRNNRWTNRKTTNKSRKQKWEAKQDYRYLKQQIKEIVIDKGWGKK